MINWFITGVSSGLGRSLAAAALARGDVVAGTTRRREDGVAFEALAPGRAHSILLDLARPDSAAAAVAQAEAVLGPIDRLVNNAGYGMVGAIEESSLDQIRALFEVNLFGAIAVIQAALPAMRARRAGQIVNVTSLSGFAPWWGTGIYGASKYALECIGQTLAQEMKPLGIHVTNIAPGGFRTGFAASGLVEAAAVIPDYDDGARNSKHALLSGRGLEGGDPDKAAQAILEALDAPQPPFHLFLGEDALRHWREHMTFVGQEVSRWEKLSLSTGYGTAE